jgi:methyl-accepting chemotaxis protein
MALRPLHATLQFLAHLRLWQKLALLGVAMSLPAVLLAIFHFSQLSAAAHQARGELDGARYLQALGTVAAEMITHRGRAYAFLSGDAARRADVSAQAAEVDHQVALMDETDTALGGRVGSGSQWQDIRTHWSQLRTQTLEQTAAQNDAAHAALAAQIGQLAETVAAASMADFDPQPQTRVLVRIASEVAPALRLAMADLRRYAVHAASKGVLGPEDRSAITILRARQVALLTDLQSALAASSDSARGPLQPLIEGAKRAADEFYGVVSTRLLSAPAITVSAAAIYDAGVPSNRALKKVSLASYDALTVATTLRLGAVNQQLVLAAVLIAALFAGALLLMWMIHRSVSRPLQQAIGIFEQIAAGNYSSQFAVQGSDEAARVLRALHDMQSRLDAQIGQARTAAAANLRIRQALDKVTVSVVLADGQRQIIYLNEAMQQLLTREQSELRKVLPRFDAQAVTGSTLESLATDPQRVRAAIEAGQGTSTDERSFGALIVRTVTSPIVDRDGNRLGTVMEWTDRSQESALEAQMQQMLTAVVEGNLSRRLAAQSGPGLFGVLGQGINQLASRLSEIVAQAQTSADEIRRAATEIASGNSDLQQRTEQQSASLEQTASSMEEMTSTVRQNADNAGQANQLARTARNQAEQGGAVVSQAVQAMTAINAASRRIADIIQTIDEIAFQTNLLALNAAVEAARAGEQGRGFAVVASEVRNLAGRSASAARQIKELIAENVSKVQDGASLVTQSGQTLEQIIAAVKKVSDIVAEIAAASREQALGIGQVNTAVSQMDAMTQQNASLVAQAGGATQAMAQQAQELHALLEHYELAQTGVRAPALRTRSAS